MKPSLFNILLFILLQGNIFPQDSIQILKNLDYRKADSIALNFPKKKYKSITEITAPLCENFKTEHEKFRTIFRWITDNIEYNRSAATIADANKIVRKNKAVCQGFASLLKEMCNSVNIDCDTISGYTKTELRDINKRLKKTDHAWNAVKLYGNWYLVDVTWATSKFNVVSRKFEKKFDDHYFITEPFSFILDHFPLNQKWQLLEKPIKRKKFIQAPIYYADYFHLNVSHFSIKKGKINLKLKKPLQVTFTAENKIENASVLLNNDRYVTPIQVNKKQGTNEYFFEYFFQKKNDYDFTLYLNNECVAEFLIKVK